jgi:ABC-type Fe3+-hydroxamate transport system substrate-binding protein
VAEVPEAIREWGRLLDTAGEADPLASRIEAELVAMAADPPAATFRYAYWIWKDPWMTISDDTYVADLLRLAGGENVYGGEAVRYPTTHPSEALAREPQVHIFPSEPYPFAEEKHGALAEKLFGSHTRRVFVDGDNYCWHGVRTLEGLKSVRALIKEVI